MATKHDSKSHSAADDNDEVKTFAETAPKNIPRAEDKVEPGGVIAPDIEDYKGKYKGHAGVVAGGEEFAVAYKPDPINRRDYRAQNTKTFWQGTREEFRKNFRMENGDEITDKNDPGTDGKGVPKPDPDAPTDKK